MTLSEELEWRGFVNQTTFKNLKDLDKQPRTFYWGVDPTADSMQIGNLAAAMMARHFIAHGYKAILLVGGATGLIGDPDGKKQERDLLSFGKIAKNKSALSAQYKQVFKGFSFEIVDNYDWFRGIRYLDFLREIGKFVPMRQMLGREFVQARLKEDGTGISYAEFSYSLIQGYDFLHLFNAKKATLQLCGADQWGNSIAGVELIRRIAGGEAHVFSCPLIVNKQTGKKFGKTEDGAIWLDEKKTSIYKFYQFWLNADDDGVIDYLKIYSLLSKQEVENIASEFKKDPSGRVAQKTLAFEVTSIVHGKKRALAVKKASEALFGGDYTKLKREDFQMLAEELPVVKAKNTKPLVTDLLVQTGLVSSKSEARRFIEGSAVYVNGVQMPKEKTTLSRSDGIAGYVVLRVGKNKNALVIL